ncbi:MAG: adaptor protein MecA [Agathobacter sp.]|nr:adaptor protein MecA [Agathobacter sp.]MDY3796462.1 adaptor protein MecA [Agathobacter sp.]
MEFSRMGKHTIKCVITEEEIFDMGYTLDEIMSNGERTQEFMNNIFDLAEQEFQTKFDMGIKTVRADFLPDHTLSLTFSEHPAGNGMMEHLKDIVNGLLNSIPSEKWEEISKRNEAEQNQDDPVKVIVLFKFKEMDTVIRFSKQVTLNELPENALYKYNNEFYLFMDLSDCTENQVMKLSMTTDEYANDIQVGPERKAFMDEHAEIILRENAIENLRQL